jgi:hypothetical protein
MAERWLGRRFCRALKATRRRLSEPHPRRPRGRTVKSAKVGLITNIDEKVAINKKKRHDMRMNETKQNNPLILTGNCNKEENE